MPNNEKKDVFISYSTKNAELAKLFCNQLEGAGVTCWIAPRDIPSGGKWAQAIPEGIEKAEIFALLVSEASVNSDEVEKEVDLANSLKKVIMPIRIENVPLRGAFQYHLSNKQWIDALNEDNFTRFSEATTEICKRRHIDGTTDGDTVALARQLANDLNARFKDKLGIIGSMFSAREVGEGRVQLFFPLRLGATGVDLIIQFDQGKSEIRIYADGASDVDRLRYPFINLMNRSFKNVFPHMKRKEGARRWEFFEIVPSSTLDSPLADLGAEAFFGVFRASAQVFTDKVMPAILSYAVYATKIGNAVDTLETRLEDLFPENEGWRVGAPEGERLKDFKDGGAIYIYKEEWLEKGEGRGFLSFAISNEKFMDNLWIGIKKSHGWLNLGEWEEKLRSQANDRVGQSATPEPDWPWWRWVDEPWRKSGLNEGEVFWDDERLQQFVDYCCGTFRELKILEGLLDETCGALPDLQIMPASEFPPQTLGTWAGNELYIENRLREIAKKLENEYRESGLSASFRFANDNANNYTYLLARCGNFDAAVVFRIWAYGQRIEIKNLDPPDFETPTISEYIKRFHPAVDLEEGRKGVNTELGGGTLQEWMDQFETFVLERSEAIVPALIALNQHLGNVTEIAKRVEKEILVADEGWLLNNEAVGLEQSAPISFWHSSWLAADAEDGDLPPVVIRIIPDSPCFDDLHMAVASTSIDTSGLDRIAGACDLVFGQGDNLPSGGFWSKPFDDQFRYTGGSLFDKRERLLDGDEKKALFDHISTITRRIEQVAPIIGNYCQTINDTAFARRYDDFIGRMTTAIKRHFPEREDWRVVANAPLNEKYGSITVFRNAWQEKGAYRGRLSFCMEAIYESFDNFCFGVLKTSDKLGLSEDQQQRLKQRLSECCSDNCSSTNWYPYHCYADNAYRYSGGSKKRLASEEQLGEMCEYFSEIFRKMKEAAPLIDEIIVELKARE